jgi:hypothetical protein
MCPEDTACWQAACCWQKQSRRLTARMARFATAQVTPTEATSGRASCSRSSKLAFIVSRPSRDSRSTQSTRRPDYMEAALDYLTASKP